MVIKDNDIRILEIIGRQTSLNDLPEIKSNSVQDRLCNDMYEDFYTEYGFVYIGDMSEDDPSLLNPPGVRGNQDADSIDELIENMRAVGWNVNFIPPIVTRDGVWKDGRRRTKSLIRLKQDWMPAILVKSKHSDKPISDNIYQGQKANSDLPGIGNNKETFVSGGVAVIEAGELERNETAIRDYLRCETAMLRWSSDLGKHTEIVNMIMKRTASNEVLPFIQNGQYWERWGATNYGSINHVPVSFYKAGTDKAPERLWQSYLNKYDNDYLNYSERDVYIPFILYSGAYDPEGCVKSIKGYMDKLAGNFRNTYKMINHHIPSVPGLNLHHLLNVNTINGTTTPSLKAGEHGARINDDNAGYILPIGLHLVGVVPNLQIGNQPELREKGLVISMTQYVSDVKKHLEIQEDPMHNNLHNILQDAAD
jgi:hypothetical protein